MNYVILDLEWNSAFSKTEHRFVNEIIEFGAVRLDENFEVVGDFSQLISPKIGKKLNGRVKELTHLTNEDVAQGTDFLTAAQRFAQFLGDSTVMTWGTGDIHALIDNFLYYTKSRRIPFLKSYCDLQEYCERAIDRFDEGNQMGLGTFAQQMEIAFSTEEQHRACADAYLAQKCLNAVRGRLALEPYVLAADCESFYERMTYKTHYITDLKSPEIDREALKFRCEVCGRQARRLKRWKLKNKNFNADFYCKACDRRFSARVSFKRRFDGVKVNRRIIK